jgi:hypothetical protein
VRARGILVAGALLLAAPSARAADDDVRRATAEYAEGMDLRVAGKIDASLEHLRLAHQIYPTPITGLELGRAYMLLGKLVVARETLLSVARIGPRAGESARASTARAEAAGIAASLGDRVPRLVFTHAGPAPAVTVDGAAVESVDTPLRLDPGAHTVSWSGASRTISLAEGQASTIDLGPSAPPAPTASERATPVQAVRPGNRAPFWIGLGLTVAATGAGAVSGLVAVGKASTARPGCPGGQCQPSVHAAADEARTWSTVSTISFVTAGVLGVATLIALAVTHDATKEPPQVGSLSLSF